MQKKKVAVETEYEARGHTCIVGETFPYLFLGAVQQCLTDDGPEVGLGGVGALAGVELGLHPGDRAHGLHHPVKHVQDHRLHGWAGQGEVGML